MGDDTRLEITWIVPPYQDAIEAIEYMQRDADQKFAGDLLGWLKEHQGGIVGPIHVVERPAKDWLFETGTYKTFSMFANVTALPAPPEFKMLGGPFDGYIMSTGGVTPWRVPMPPPIPTVLGYGGSPYLPRNTYAEYERIPGTQSYRFNGIRS